jgi:hypothetical protein
MPKYCEYVFTNNSKSHKKGEVCNCVIRKKGVTYCWKHERTLDNAPEFETKQPADTNYIQLENS